MANAASRVSFEARADESSLPPAKNGWMTAMFARASKLTRDAALANYQALVSDTLLSVRIAYQDILLAAEQITVQEASVHLLEQELADTKRRFDAGTVPRFNVLRAEVELANAKPRLFRARNALRISKNNLAVLLGFNIPKGTDQDIPLKWVVIGCLAIIAVPAEADEIVALPDVIRIVPGDQAFPSASVRG